MPLEPGVEANGVGAEPCLIPAPRPLGAQMCQEPTTHLPMCKPWACQTPLTTSPGEGIRPR